MVGTLHWIAALGVHPPGTLLARAWFLFGQIAIGGLAFLAAARMLGVEELRVSVELILKKFAANVPSAPENREAPIA
jgi:hypothetical protein